MKKWKRNGQREFTGTHKGVQEGIISSFNIIMINKINLEMSVIFFKWKLIDDYNKIYFENVKQKAVCNELQ